MSAPRVYVDPGALKVDAVIADAMTAAKVCEPAPDQPPGQWWPRFACGFEGFPIGHRRAHIRSAIAELIAEVDE